MNRIIEIEDSESSLEAMVLRDGNEQVIRHAMVRMRSAIDVDASIRGFIFTHADEGGTVECIVRVEPNARLRWQFGYMKLPSLNRGYATVMNDCLFIGGNPDLPAFMQELMSSLATRAEVDVVAIPRVPSDLVSDAGPLIVRSGFDVSRQYEVSGMTILGTKEESIARLKKKRRYNINRQLRKIMDDHGGVIRVFQSRSEVETFLDAIRPVQRATYQNEIAITVTNSRSRREAVLASSDQKEHLCFTLEIDGEIAAFQIGQIRGSMFDLEEIGFDRRFERLAPGMSLLYASIDELAKNGIEYMSFGVGSAQYKSVLADQIIACCDFVGFSGGVKNRLDRMIARVARLVHRGVIALLPDLKLKIIKKKIRKILTRSDGHAGKMAC